MNLVRYPITDFYGYKEFHRIRHYLPKLNLENGPWIAGGSLVRLIKGLPFWNDICDDENRQNIDIDIFFQNKEAFLKTKDNIKLIRKRCFETENAFSFTFNFENKRHTIQCISKYIHNNVEELFNAFDFTVSQIATDLETVVMPDYVMDDLKNNKLILATGKYNNENFIKRVFKYAYS